MTVQSAPPKYAITKEDRRLCWAMVLPALTEALLLHLFGMIDTLMLGNTVDSAVNIAAVSIANTPQQFVRLVLTAFAMGTTTAIAFFIGKKETERASAAVRQGILFMLIASAAVSLLSIVFAHPIMDFAGAKDELHACAVSYFCISMAGFVPEMLTIAITACMRGIGVTRIALIYNVIASALNVVGNYLLIYGKFGFPEMGASGAALSTSLSKCISFVIALWYLLCTNSVIRLRFTESFRFTKDVIGRIFKVGIPAAIEQAILQGGNILAVKIIAALDTPSIAAFNVCTTINGLTWKPGYAFQVAATSFVSRDLGEGRPEKARARSMMIFRYSLSFSAFMTVFLLIFREQTTALFSPDPQIIALASSALIFDAASVFFITTYQTFAGVLHAAGDGRFLLITSMIGMWLSRVVLALILLRLGLLSTMTGRICVAFGLLIRATFLMIRFLKTKKLSGHGPNPERKETNA